MATKKTAKTAETTTVTIEELNKKYGPTVVSKAMEKNGNDLDRASSFLEMFSEVELASKKDKKDKAVKVKEARAEASAEEKKKLLALFKAAFPKDKTGVVPEAIFGIRFENRGKTTESISGFSNILAGIRYEKDGKDRCLQAFIPLYRKREGLDITLEAGTAEAEKELVTIMRDVVSLLG